MLTGHGLFARLMAVAAKKDDACSSLVDNVWIRDSGAPSGRHSRFVTMCVRIRL